LAERTSRRIDPNESGNRGNDQLDAACRFDGKKPLEQECALGRLAPKAALPENWNWRDGNSADSVTSPRNLAVLSHALRWRPDHSSTCGDSHRTLAVYCFTQSVRVKLALNSILV
jgi:hypothetical protein